MFIRRRLDRLVIPLIVLLTVTYFSYHPQFQLNPQMPGEFVDGSVTGPAQRRPAEAKIANAYWACAVNNVQWQYGYGHRLPPDPPHEFNVTTKEAGGADPDASTRTRYWHRLQMFWSFPGAWKKTYVWDIAWTTSWIKSTGDWLYTHMPEIR
jgi:hypothetical protein